MPQENLEKKKVTKADFLAAIQEPLTELIRNQVESSLEPIKAQQTEWFAKLREEKPRAYENDDPSKKGIGAARVLRALAFGRGDMERAKYFCQKSWDDELGEVVLRTLQASDLTAGGVLVPPDFVPEVIELLRARTVVRAAGARMLPMNVGTLTLRKQTAASTATYVGEAQNISKTEPTTGQLVMTAKKLAAIVPISNDLLMFSSGPQADEFVRDDLIQVLAIREDLAFIRDTGLEHTPKGLRYWAAAANVTASNGTSSTNIEDDFKDLVNDLEQADVRMIRPAWFMAPRSKNHLRNLRDANGNLIYPEIRNTTPTLYGWPVFTTTSIPTNLGGGANETEVYLVDMVDAVIGDASTLEIAVDSSASYIESGSTLVSAFSRDETLMRAISRHDFAVRHAESVAIKNAVSWGA